jgi:hypothetical protein
LSDLNDNEVVANANREGYALVERELAEQQMWSWTGTDHSAGWWPTRTLAIEHMRDVQQGGRRSPVARQRSRPRRGRTE